MPVALFDLVPHSFRQRLIGLVDLLGHGSHGLGDEVHMAEELESRGLVVTKIDDPRVDGMIPDDPHPSSTLEFVNPLTGRSNLRRRSGVALRIAG